MLASLYVFRGAKGDLIKIVWLDGIGMSARPSASSAIASSCRMSGAVRGVPNNGHPTAQFGRPLEIPFQSRIGFTRYFRDEHAPVGELNDRAAKISTSFK